MTTQVPQNMIVGGPAFSSYAGATTSFSSSTYTKVSYQNKDFDTANAFDATTNFRFTPQVAGYYQVNASCSFAVNTTGGRWIALWKNGSQYKVIGFGTPNSLNYTEVHGTALIYLNGSTDYIEIYAQQNSGGTLANAGNNADQFSAVLVRAA